MDQNSDEVTSIDFRLRIASGPDGHGALIFDGTPGEAVPRFLTDLVEALFPPGRTSESSLTVETTGARVLIYEAFGVDNRVTISLREVPIQAAEVVRTSLERHGAIALLFGGTIDGEFALLDPVATHIMRRMAIIDHELVFGGHYSDDWAPFLSDLRGSIPILAVN